MQKTKRPKQPFCDGLRVGGKAPVQGWAAPPGPISWRVGWSVREQPEVGADFCCPRTCQLFRISSFRPSAAHGSRICTSGPGGG